MVDLSDPFGACDLLPHVGIICDFVGAVQAPTGLRVIRPVQHQAAQTQRCGRQSPRLQGMPLCKPQRHH